MIFEDWHTHHDRCRHASGTLREYVEKAIELQLSTIGLSTHFPYGYLDNLNGIPYKEYAMDLSELDEFFNNAESLREEFVIDIKVKIGFEVDFFEDKEPKLNYYLNKYLPRLDYIIGSIHMLKLDSGYFPLDDSRYLNFYEVIGIDEIYTLYFQKLQKMLQSPVFEFDIVGHFDLPKKFKLKPLSSDNVQKEIQKTLKLIKEKDKVIEINTSGLRKAAKEQYPSLKIIERMYDWDIPIILGSDSHNPEELGYEFIQMIQKLKKVGYTELQSYSKRKRTSIKI